MFFKEICTDSLEIWRGNLKFSALEVIAQEQAKKKEQKRENMTEKQRAERDPQKKPDNTECWEWDGGWDL